MAARAHAAARQAGSNAAFSAYAKELSTGAAAESRLASAVRRHRHLQIASCVFGQTLMSARRYTLSDQIVRSPGVVVPITPAGVDTALGELLLALGRAEAAGQRFDRALSTESGSVRAQIDKAVAARAAPHTEAAPAASGDWFADYMVGVTLVERSESIDRSSWRRHGWFSHARPPSERTSRTCRSCMRGPTS